MTDDHAVVREGLRLLIDAQPGMSVVGEASDVPTARDELRRHAPRVLLLDVNLAGESGVDAIPQLRAESPDTDILVLTMEKQPAIAGRALAAGAAGYVVKEAAARELVRAIETVASGQRYVQPEIGGSLLQQGLERAAEPLSPRERDVLRLIAMGYTNTQVAEQLFLSVRTVESHRASIYDKTGLRNRAGLVRYALDRGLVEE